MELLERCDGLVSVRDLLAELVVELEQLAKHSVSFLVFVQAKHQDDVDKELHALDVVLVMQRDVRVLAQLGEMLRRHHLAPEARNRLRVEFHGDLVVALGIVNLFDFHTFGIPKGGVFLARNLRRILSGLDLVLLAFGHLLLFLIVLNRFKLPLQVAEELIDEVLGDFVSVLVGLFLFDQFSDLQLQLGHKRWAEVL